VTDEFGRTITVFRLGDTTFTYEDNTNTNDGLYIDDHNYVNAVNGLNILVYSKDLELVVDSAYMNVYESLGVLRTNDEKFLTP